MQNLWFTMLLLLITNGNSISGKMKKIHNESSCIIEHVVLLNFDDNVGSQIFVATHELDHLGNQDYKPHLPI